LLGNLLKITQTHYFILMKRTQGKRKTSKNRYNYLIHPFWAFSGHRFFNLIRYFVYFFVYSIPIYCYVTLFICNLQKNDSAANCRKYRKQKFTIKSNKFAKFRSAHTRNSCQFTNFHRHIASHPIMKIKKGRK
jgi:hypothetical protein